MLIILSMLLVCLFIGWCTWGVDDYFLEGFIPSIVIASLLIAVTWGFSYSSYLDLRKYQYTVEQYKSSIILYKNTVVLDSDDALTDMKYNKNTDALREMINSLKYKIVNYNNILIGKRIMKENIFFNWLIVAPDKDMKPVKLLDEFNLERGQ